VNLVPFLSVAENICLGRQRTRFGCIRWGDIRERARKAMGRLGIDLDVSEPLSNYSIAIQQLVAIARALDISAKLLILDEPTSSLDAGEVERLFGVMRQLKSEGLAIIFVTTSSTRFMRCRIASRFCAMANWWVNTRPPRCRGSSSSRG